MKTTVLVLAVLVVALLSSVIAQDVIVVAQDKASVIIDENNLANGRIDGVMHDCSGWLDKILLCKTDPTPTDIREAVKQTIINQQYDIEQPVLMTATKTHDEESVESVPVPVTNEECIPTSVYNKTTGKNDSTGWQACTTTVFEDQTVTHTIIDQSWQQIVFPTTTILIDPQKEWCFDDGSRFICKSTQRCDGSLHQPSWPAPGCLWRIITYDGVSTQHGDEDVTRATLPTKQDVIADEIALKEWANKILPSAQ